MTLTPQVQTLVDQLVQQLGLQTLRPSSMKINLDREGIVQDVTPKLVFKREPRKFTVPVSVQEPTKNVDKRASLRA